LVVKGFEERILLRDAVLEGSMISSLVNEWEVLGRFAEAGDKQSLLFQNLGNGRLESSSQTSELEGADCSVQVIHVDEVLEAEAQASTVAEVGNNNVQEHSLISPTFGTISIGIESLSGFNDSHFNRCVWDLLQELRNTIKSKPKAFGTVGLVVQQVHERTNQKFKGRNIANLKET